MNDQMHLGTDQDEIDEEERGLSLQDKLAHKKWQIRKKAYNFLALMFQKVAQGDKFWDRDSDGREFEYNPLEKYEDWVSQGIRDSNLTAQGEGLNTLYVFLVWVPDGK